MLKKTSTTYLMIFCCLICYSLEGIAQPYVDIISVNSQQLHTKYKSGNYSNTTVNSFAGLLLPVQIDSSNTIIVRVNAEMLKSKRDSAFQMTNKVYATTVSLGYQHIFAKKLTVTALFMPKFASDLKDKMSGEDYQFGGSVLFQYRFSNKFRAKAGLFYNREPFGNFFVPLFGVDWQISKRLMLYGTFPLINRLEFKVADFLYTGIGARIYGRSYRLNRALNSDYVWNQENQVKYFIDCYFLKKIVLYAEVGRTFGYGPKLIANGQSRENVLYTYPLYSPIKDGFFFNFGMAFRIRKPI